MLPFTEASVATVLATLARTAGWSFAAPMIGDKATPPKVRLGIAIMLALALFGLRAPVDPETLFAVAPGELLFGLLAGYSTRLVLAGAEAAGQLIGIELGLGFAGTFDPDARDESLPTRRIALILASLAFLEAGGLESSIGLLGIAKVDGRSILHAMMSVIEGSDQIFFISVRAAAPLLVASVIMNLSVALASRAAPALNVFSVMLALFLLIGGIVLLATSPSFIREMIAVGTHASQLEAVGR